jgi:hypothetical protein
MTNYNDPTVIVITHNNRISTSDLPLTLVSISSKNNREESTSETIA